MVDGFEGTEEVVILFSLVSIWAPFDYLSFIYLFRNLNSKVERSQSCSDTAQDRAKSRLRAAPTSKTKVHFRHRLLELSTPIL